MEHAITTAEEVIAATGIVGRDAQITALIPLVEEWIMGYTNQLIPDPEGNYPAGYKKIAIEMVAHDINTLKSKGISSESLSRHSISFNAVSDYPPTILRGLRRRVRW